MDRLPPRDISLLGALCAAVFVAAGCSGELPSGPRRPVTADAGVGGTASGVEAAGGAPGDASAGTGASEGEARIPEPPEPLATGEPCNGRESYCALAYDQVCFAATHDSAANSSAYWEAPAEDRSILEQLGNGIRALSLSVYDVAGTATVCRRSCDEGSTPLASVLADLAQFFDANPREVVTLLVDSEVSAGTLADEFAAKGLDARALAQHVGDPWPSLGALIDADTRLVVLANANGAGPAWLLPRSELLWETGRDWPSLAAMTCTPDVGNEARPLYLVHQNLVTGDGAPDPALARQANALDVVAERLEDCRDRYARTPNFVAVDFSSEGDVVDATQVLNGVRTIAGP